MSKSDPSPSPPERHAAGGALAEVIRVADPSLRAHAAARPPHGRYESAFPADPDRAFVVESVHEGWLLHYGTPRAFKGMDEDLRLLGGDALYALGLSRLAALGDLAGVAELAELISLCAQAAAEHRSELGTELWSASARALAGEREAGARAAFARLAPRTSPEGVADRTPRRR